MIHSHLLSIRLYPVGLIPQKLVKDQEPVDGFGLDEEKTTARSPWLQD